MLHRDIKPANILMNRYGRPHARRLQRLPQPPALTGPAGEIFGGTLGYMAPEHIDAFNPLERGTTPAAVDERSDIYSLGLVLYELLIGKLPFEPCRRPTQVGESPFGSGQRAPARNPVAAPSGGRAEVLDRVVRRCLDPRPTARYQTAAELALALQGCREHRRVEKELPRGGVLTRLAFGTPVLVGLFLCLAEPVRSANISHDAVRIVGQLTPEQQPLRSAGLGL